MITQTVYELDFIDAFKAMNRAENFCYESLKYLFDYYNEQENYDLDVIAICCEWSEMDSEEYASNFCDGYELSDYDDIDEMLADCASDNDHIVVEAWDIVKGSPVLNRHVYLIQQ